MVQRATLEGTSSDSNTIFSSSQLAPFKSSDEKAILQDESDAEHRFSIPTQYNAPVTGNHHEIRSKMMSKHEAFENVVATFVDIGSVMVAYAIGMHQSNFMLGVAYALFDAFIVVWMRKPLSHMIRSAVALRIGRAVRSDTYIADVA